MVKAKFIPFVNFCEQTLEEMQTNAKNFNEKMQKRRTIRDFSAEEVPLEVIENCLETAGTAPNGANKQPWHFVVVGDKKIKSTIRQEAEKEEREFYEKRATKEWLEALEPLGTDSNKPFLETAPYLIAIFDKKYNVLPNGTKSKNYYSSESVGIATGILIAAIHNAGLVSLTHTPSPMGFLNKILNRPINEKPFLLLVVGFPEKNAVVPDIKRKSLAEISTFL
ncbi:nitroreductase family protein [bacterium]|nr:nitroreductase family protein [bacterium]